MYVQDKIVHEQLSMYRIEKYMKHYLCTGSVYETLSVYRIEEYMKQLPIKKVPRIGTDGEKYR